MGTSPKGERGNTVGLPLKPMTEFWVKRPPLESTTAPDVPDTVAASTVRRRFERITVSPAIFPYDEVLYGGSSEDDSDSTRARKRMRREGYAMDYQKYGSVPILTASLRGPFDNGWRNPWDRSHRRATPSASVKYKSSSSTALVSKEPKRKVDVFIKTETHKTPSSRRQIQAADVNPPRYLASPTTPTPIRNVSARRGIISPIAPRISSDTLSRRWKRPTPTREEILPLATAKTLVAKMKRPAFTGQISMGTPKKLQTSEESHATQIHHQPQSRETVQVPSHHVTADHIALNSPKASIPDADSDWDIEVEEESRLNPVYRRIEECIDNDYFHEDESVIIVLGKEAEHELARPVRALPVLHDENQSDDCLSEGRAEHELAKVIRGRLAQQDKNVAGEISLGSTSMGGSIELLAQLADATKRVDLRTRGLQRMSQELKSSPWLNKQQTGTPSREPPLESKKDASSPVANASAIARKSQEAQEATSQLEAELERAASFKPIENGAIAVIDLISKGSSPLQSNCNTASTQATSGEEKEAIHSVVRSPEVTHTEIQKQSRTVKEPLNVKTAGNPSDVAANAINGTLTNVIKATNGRDQINSDIVSDAITRTSTSSSSNEVLSLKQDPCRSADNLHTAKQLEQENESESEGLFVSQDEDEEETVALRDKSPIDFFIAQEKLIKDKATEQAQANLRAEKLQYFNEGLAQTYQKVSDMVSRKSATNGNKSLAAVSARLTPEVIDLDSSDSEDIPLSFQRASALASKIGASRFAAQVTYNKHSNGSSIDRLATEAPPLKWTTTTEEDEDSQGFRMVNMGSGSRSNRAHSQMSGTESVLKSFVSPSRLANAETLLTLSRSQSQQHDSAAATTSKLAALTNGNARPPTTGEMKSFLDSASLGHKLGSHNSQRRPQETDESYLEDAQQLSHVIADGQLDDFLDEASAYLSTWEVEQKSFSKKDS